MEKKSPKSHLIKALASPKVRDPQRNQARLHPELNREYTVVSARRLLYAGGVSELEEFILVGDKWYPLATVTSQPAVDPLNLT